jgi:hypothetical protein
MFPFFEKNLRCSEKNVLFLTAYAQLAPPQYFERFLDNFA